MGKAIRASALVLLLACTAQAGWMQADKTQPPPPPPPATAAQEQTTAGNVPTNTDGDTQDDAADAMTQTVLNLLAGVLTLV